MCHFFQFLIFHIVLIQHITSIFLANKLGSAKNPNSKSVPCHKQKQMYYLKCKNGNI